VGDTEMGQLVGGPHDGVRFSVEHGFWYQASDELPEPAQRVYVGPDGRLAFWFSGSLAAPALFGPRPPLSRYDLNPDDGGWVYVYAGEEQR
jgi:hypothetical protein